MKFNKTIILVPLLIILVVSLSGCITDDLFKQGETFEKNGITFQYPDTWQEVNSVAEGSVGAVALKNNSEVSTVIQQVPSEYGTEVQQAFNTNKVNLVKSPNYINVQETPSTLNGKDVIIHRYIVNEDDGSQKERVATWIKMDDNKLYVLLFSTPVDSYEVQRSSYDLIAGTFALKGQTNNNNANTNNNASTNTVNSDSSIIGMIQNQVDKFFSN